MLENGARWYGETPQGKAEANTNRVKTGKMSTKTFESGYPSLDGVNNSHFTSNRDSAFRSSVSDYQQRQNQWLVTSLCCM